MEKLNELVKAKFGEIRGAIRLLPGDFREHAMGIDKALHNYCMETREDLPAPGEAIFLSDGTVRIRNLWGDKYLDIPEDFAVKVLILGFLP